MTRTTPPSATRRQVLRGLAAAAGTSLAAPAIVAAQGGTTIRMWTFLNPAGQAPRERALRDIIAAFEAANPGTRVVVEPQVWDQMTPKFLTAARQGNAPDIVWVVTDLLGDAIRSGALADLNELFVSGWPEERRRDNAGAYWDLCSVGGKQYCLFTSRNYIAIVYRTDLFREAGIDPAGVRTWDQFREAAQRLTVRDGANVTRWGFGQGFSENQPDPQIVVARLIAAQGSPFTADGRARFATEAGIEGLRFQCDLITRYSCCPRQAATWTVDDVIEQFSSDRLAMYIGASVRISGVQARVGRDKVSMMLWPSVDGQRPSPAVMAGWAVSVWSGSRNRALAGRFVEFMSGPVGDRHWVETGGQTPGLLSTAAAMPQFFADPANAYLQVASRGSAEAGWLSPIDFGVGSYRQLLNKAAQEVVINNMDPRAALEAAEREFNRRNNR
jgi:multiple sugar transport system substrate-binding protein